MISFLFGIHKDLYKSIIIYGKFFKKKKGLWKMIYLFEVDRLRGHRAKLIIFEF